MAVWYNLGFVILFFLILKTTFRGVMIFVFLVPIEKGARG